MELFFPHGGDEVADEDGDVNADGTDADAYMFFCSLVHRSRSHFGIADDDVLYDDDDKDDDEGDGADAVSYMFQCCFLQYFAMCSR